jgi:hypothetical protein
VLRVPPVVGHLLCPNGRIHPANAAGKSPVTGLDVARAHYLKNHVDQYATRVMVMEERATPVQTYVLDRGVYDKPLKNRPRERITPAAFPPPW